MFIGKNAADQPIKVLILGESHYEDDGKIEGTHGVVDYLAVCGNDNDTQFYKNIMKAFGYDITLEQRKRFWSKVYCGNYVSDLCGIRESNTAAEKIKYNRKQYNNELFTYINGHEIDVVFCFSRLVYNNLPSAVTGEKELLLIEHNTNYLKQFKYQDCVKYQNCDVLLKKPLIVYGLKHPSAGFSSDVYCTYFKEAKGEMCL